MTDMFDIRDVMDWASIKLTAINVTFAVLTGNQILMAFTLVSVITTIILNTIKIVKAIQDRKKSKQNG